MIIQSLLGPRSEPSNDGRTSTDGESPNETFARALAESIQAAGGAGADPRRRGFVDRESWAGFERTENRIDHRSETALDRTGGNDRPVPIRPSVGRPAHAAGHRPDDHRSEDRGHDRRVEDRGHDRTGRVEVARPGDSNTERPGAQVVDPAGHAVRPETPGSDNGSRVTFDHTFGDTTKGGDPAGGLYAQDSPLATAVASLMAVETGDAAAFLQALMAGLTRSQGVESAEELMAGLATLAERLGGGDTATGVNGADTELVAAVIDAAVDAGLVEPMASDAHTDPTALLAAVTSAIAGDGTSEVEGNEGAVVDETSATVEGAGAGGGIDLPDPESGIGTGELTEGQGGYPGPDDSAASVDATGDNTGVEADNSSVAATPNEGTGHAGVGDATVEGGAGNGTVYTTTDGSTEATPDGTDNAAAERIAPGPTTARAGDSSIDVTSSATQGEVGGPAGVTASGRASAPARSATAAPTPSQGLVELADNRLAEQLRPAFAAVRRGIDGLEELQLRLRNEGGAPIRVDISTADGEVRVVLSGTNDDVMQRLGQERERLADELRRAGFTSTTIDVHSEGAGDDHRRPGTRTSLDSTGGRSYDTGGTGEEAMAGAVSEADRSTTTGLDLDL